MFRLGPLRSSHAKEVSFALHVVKDPMFGSTAGENLVPEKKRKHRRIVIGSLDTLRDESAALKAIAALRRESTLMTLD